MRVQILSALSATLLIGAVPAVASVCPRPATRPVVHHRVTHVVRARVLVRRIVHVHTVVVIDRGDVNSWQGDHRDWSDNRWRMDDRGCQTWQRSETVIDHGDRRTVQDHGMPCHDQRAHVDRGWSFAQQEAWSTSEHHGAWHEDAGWASGRTMMTDRFGYLTWPGKTHFINGQPVDEAQPSPPQQGPWQVHP